MSNLEKIEPRDYWVVDGAGRVVGVQRKGASDPTLFSAAQNRIVATKCVVASNSNTTNRQIMSRTHHIALTRIRYMSVEYPNWYVSANNTGELTAAGTATLAVGLEYPLGTLAGVFTFGGNVQGTAAGLGSFVSDTISGFDIPAGDVFCLRPYFVGSAGIIFTDEKAGNAIDCATFAVSGVADLSQSTGLFTDTQPGIAYRPVAIVGATTIPTIALPGTSRVLGLNDIASDIYGGRGILERSVGKLGLGYIRMGAAGEQLQTILVANGATNFARRKSLIDRYCTYIASDYGINDLNSGGRSAAQVTTDLQTAVSLFGKPWLHCTLSPVATSSDNFATTANQTTNATVNPKRITFNASVRSGAGGIAGFFEMADAVESARDSGKWKADGSTANLWTSDGTHESQFACQFIENSPQITAPLNLIR